MNLYSNEKRMKMEAFGFCKRNRLHTLRGWVLVAIDLPRAYQLMQIRLPSRKLFFGIITTRN